MVFARFRKQLIADLPRLAGSLTPAGTLWVAWPKRNSGAETDLSDAVVRELGLGTALVDVKVCSVSAEWSGLKFVRRLRDRPSHEGERPLPHIRGGRGSALEPNTSERKLPGSGATLMERVP
ncbi:MAG: hypothetical protein L3J77_01590 [Thermoplasmata archaeon]|nr:hypothetical protein [Thermoplasmata archaeon]